MKLTVDRLRSLLYYSPDSGTFTWIANPLKGRNRIGNRAGSLNKKYWMIKIDQRSYQASRLAWFYVHGRWPTDQIDHIDQNTLNNSISNLRDVTASVNEQNQRHAHSNNTTGRLGVIKRRKKWIARIELQGKVHWIGTFPCVDSAHAAYVLAKRSLHEGCTI